MKLCGFDIGLDKPFFLIAGPCVVESEQLQMDTAGTLKEITSSLGIPFIFKSSFDKANRSSGASFRGPGRDKGLDILGKVKRELGLPPHDAAKWKILPPSDPPNWFCRNFGLTPANGLPGCGTLKTSFASNMSLRRNSNSVP